MSDVREVTEWHEAMEGTLTVAGERLGDAWDNFAEAVMEATKFPNFLKGLLGWNKQ